MNEAAAQTTLRDSLVQQFDAADEVSPIESTSAVVASDPSPDKEARARDEAGKFSRKPEADPIAAENTPEPQVKPRPARPSSWKKEYESHWETLDPTLAEYINQRESEYAKGVSTYKNEADRARELTEAMSPFMGDLQRYNISPQQWISNLGNAYHTLALGSPEQKSQMIALLAQDFGIDLGQFSGQQSDPRLMTMAQQLQMLQSQVENTTRTQQQREQQEILAHINEFASNTEAHPHYEQVKDTMAQLLGSGMAPDLETAYVKAVRLNDDAWNAEQARQQQAQDSERHKAAAAARAKAVSVKTATPSGSITTGAKDRRALLSEGLESVANGRL